MRILNCLFFSLLSLALSGGVLQAEEHPVNSIPDSNNKIIKLTDKGISPEVLSLSLADSIVFLLNDSTDSLATIELDYGKKVMHCAGSNTRAFEDGKIRSTRPFGPRDFASTCFHEPGTYQLKVFGLKANPSGISSTIRVE